MATGFLKRLALPIIALSSTMVPVLAQTLGEEQAIQLPDMSKALDFVFGFPVGTPTEVLMLKILFFFALIAIFSALLVKTKIFGDNNSIAAIVGLIVALIAVKFTPIDPLLTFASTLGVSLSVLLVLGIPIGFLWFVWTIIPSTNTHKWQIMGAAMIFAGATLIAGNITSVSIAKIFGPSSFFAQIAGFIMIVIGAIMFFRTVNFLGWRAAFRSAEATEKDVDRELADIRAVDVIEAKEVAVDNTIESELTALQQQVAARNFTYAMPAIERIEKELTTEVALLKTEQQRLKQTIAQAKAAISNSSGSTKSNLKTYLVDAEKRLKAIETSLEGQNNVQAALLKEEFADMKTLAILLKEGNYIAANEYAQRLKVRVIEIKNKKLLETSQERKLTAFVGTLLGMTKREAVIASQGRVETTILTNGVSPILATVRTHLTGVEPTLPAGPAKQLVTGAITLTASAILAVHTAESNTNPATRENLLKTALKELEKANTEITKVSMGAGLGANTHKVMSDSARKLSTAIADLEKAINEDLVRLRELKSR